MEFTQNVFPLSRIGEYICGICIGYLVCMSHGKQNKQRSSIISSILDMITMIIWIAGMYIKVDSWHYRILHWILPNSFLIFVFAQGKGVVSKVFNLGFLRYLGDISFECFLLHQIVIIIYKNVTGLEAISILGNVFSILICLIITVMIASLISKKQLKLRSKN